MLPFRATSRLKVDLLNAAVPVFITRYILGHELWFEIILFNVSSFTAIWHPVFILAFTVRFSVFKVPSLLMIVNPHVSLVLLYSIVPFFSVSVPLLFIAFVTLVPSNAIVLPFKSMVTVLSKETALSNVMFLSNVTVLFFVSPDIAASREAYIFPLLSVATTFLATTAYELK